MTPWKSASVPGWKSRRCIAPATISSPEPAHETDERFKVLHTESRSSTAKTHVWIDRRQVRPIRRHGGNSTVRQLEADSILSPEPFRDYEPKRPAAKRVKRVRDLNPVSIDGIVCI